MKPDEKVYNPEQESRDLGFGSILSGQQQFRLLNRDGSFNVERQKPGLLRTIRSYHLLLSMSWKAFFAIVILAYIGLNALFGLGYLACGPGALQGDSGTSGYWRVFFFSVHTFSTIGYGNVTPVGVIPNLLVTVESLVALLGFALATGLLFARFSRPTAEIIYSRNAVIAPYRGITAFEFRIINGRDNQLIEMQASLVLARFEDFEGSKLRRYYPLELERPRVAFFPLNWTVVHPIDRSSPLYGWTESMLLQSEAEFLVLLTGIDDTFSQTVHSRSSYIAGEVVWGARFAPLIQAAGIGHVKVDLDRFHAVERVPLVAIPSTSASLPA